MAKLAMFIKTTCKPGRRDEVRALWEEYLKPRAQENPTQEVYFCCYDNMNENVMYLFELYGSHEGFGANAQAPWFMEYMQKVGPLLEGQPEVGMATPLWAKGAAL